jgi:hypothetical protein
MGEPQAREPAKAAASEVMTEPMWTAPLESVATAYAAIVATAAFALEVRRWLKERPKLDITFMPDAVMFTSGGSDEDEDENDEFLLVNVVNLGGATTTIEGLSLVEFTTFGRRWLRRPNRSFIVPQPQPKGYPINVPSELKPNERWTGIISKRSTEVDIETGIFYAQIAATHSKRTTLKRIPRKPKWRDR